MLPWQHAYRPGLKSVMDIQRAGPGPNDLLTPALLGLGLGAGGGPGKHPEARKEGMIEGEEGRRRGKEKGR